MHRLDLKLDVFQDTKNTVSKFDKKLKNHAIYDKITDLLTHTFVDCKKSKRIKFRKHFKYLIQTLTY